MNDVATVQPPIKRGEMTLETLDKQTAGAVEVSAVAGGVSFASALEVMEFSKLMALADKAVPKHLRKNPGACLAVVFQAVEWRMSPFAVANKSYEVNDRIAYESQLIHAVIEARAPLQKRLECKYEGELVYSEVEREDEETKEKFKVSVLNRLKSTRKCVVTGYFTSGDVREYESPEFRNIKVKNSPLWDADPDQQLWYYASRSWARKWCPDVLMGIYSREELLENSALGREEEPAPAGSGLHARLSGTELSDEGHKPGHVESELAHVAAGAGAIIDAKAETATDTAHAEGDDKKGGKSKKKTKAADAPQQANAEPTTPKNPSQYATYAGEWIAASTDLAETNKRWDSERALRNNCGVTFEDRQPVEAKLIERREQLEKKE